jgi:hypothetical protein
MVAPQEQSKSRENNESREAKGVSQREVLPPLETRPATGAAFQDGEHTIVPTLQHLAIGDVMPAAPGARDIFRVGDFIPATMLLLGVPATNTAGGAGKTPASSPTYDRSWVFVLQETPAHHTRLMTRGRLGNVALPSPRSEKPFLARFAAPSEFLYASMMQLPKPVLHAAEAPTIARLHAFIREQGYAFDGTRQKHHEIYLSDPRRGAPEKMKTVLRQPMMRLS